MCINHAGYHTDREIKQRGREVDGKERALAEKKELQTNSEGENIINRSTESIK